jgi:outer membrane protein assembly factor BamA
MKRQNALTLVVLTALVWGGAAQPAVSESGASRWKLAAIHVTGSQLFKEQRIAQASGLKVGSAVGQDDLHAAAQRLAASGAFAHVGFRYGPGLCSQSDALV